MMFLISQFIKSNVSAQWSISITINNFTAVLAMCYAFFTCLVPRVTFNTLDECSGRGVTYK